MAETIEDMEKRFDKSKEIAQHFLLPLQDITLGLKLVEKDKRNKKITPYVKMEIMIPQEIGTTIVEVLTSKWKLALMGVQYKKNKK